MLLLRTHKTSDVPLVEQVRTFDLKNIDQFGVEPCWSSMPARRRQHL